MEKEKRIEQIIVKLTKSEKRFLTEKAEEEDRTISVIVKSALRSRYPEFGK